MSDQRLIVVIDGSNVAHSTSWQRVCGNVGAEVSRTRLVEAISSWAVQFDADVYLVFDGAGPYGVGDHELTPHVVVRGSGAQSGDQVIEHRCAALAQSSHRYSVVSSDQLISSTAGSKAERVWKTEIFVTEQLDAGVSTNESNQSDVAPPGSIAQRVDAKTASALERLRRGQ